MPFHQAKDSFVCTSSAMQKLMQQVDIVGPHLRVALIEGESGAGKHALARLLYERFAACHLEIRQSGYTRWDAREWLLAETDPQSHAGFIFLDRVDLLAAPGQALLLRILKDLVFRNSGSLVVVGSAESSLRDLARNGQFQAELAVRLSSVRLIVPPLRERREDILPIAVHFLGKLCTRYRSPLIHLAPGAAARIVEYHWPGNLHELSSILESALIECSNGIIRSEDLSLPIPRLEVRPAPRQMELLNLDCVIHHHIQNVLQLNRGNKLRAARQLGISRSTLYRLLEKRLSLPG
jgi:DNA-binding NtrC family response regulator